MARMRFPAQALEEIKRLDPETCLSPYALRQLLLSGAVPYILIGRRRLVNLDALEDYLASGGSNPDDKSAEIVATHRVREVRQ